jgi:hypothetical protein
MPLRRSLKKQGRADQYHQRRNLGERHNIRDGHIGKSHDIAKNGGQLD